MTGNEILNVTLDMLGYNNDKGNIQSRIKTRAITLINLVYSDLHGICNSKEFNLIKNLSDDIKLPDDVLHDVFPYGLAMFIAQTEFDGEQQQIWSQYYAQKRTKLSKNETIIDIIPRCY